MRCQRAASTCLALLVAIGCGGTVAEDAPSAIEMRAHPPAAPAGGEIFEDVTEAVGLDFVHWNGMSGELYYQESVGPGVALFDFDNDGDLDVFLGQGGMLGPGKTLEDAVVPPVMAPPLIDRLYRNDLAKDGTLRLVDVTLGSGIDGNGYAMGMATGDVDGDGWTDLFVANFRADRLWRNLGDGTFRDITAEAGVDDERWNASASFLDYDRDGDLDLFVTGYVAASYANHRPCRLASGRLDYCGPENFRCETDRLYRNRGDGTFEDVSGPAGILGACGRGLGVVAADYDADGWVDLYVANDLDRNHLWRNRGDGTFEDVALLRGCAVSGEGRAEASMGLVVGDLDEDGDADLFLAHLRTETHTAYFNDGRGFFEDVSNRSGLGPPSLPSTGFGVALVDFDNDGWLDLGVVNGAVSILEEQAEAGDPLPLRQPNQLFHNTGDGSFDEVPAVRAGSAFSRPEVSRGVAVGDLDNDGAQDLVLTNNNGPARVLLNRAGAGRPFLGLRLVGPSGRDVLGAAVIVRLDDGTVRHRLVATDGSFLSAGDPRVVVGLGQHRRVESVLVRWPSGVVEGFGALESGRYHVLAEGSGTGAEGSGTGAR